MLRVNGDIGCLLCWWTRSFAWWLTHNHKCLQSGKEQKISFGTKGTKRKYSDSEEESDAEEPDSGDQSESEDDLDFGHGGPDVVGFSTLQDALTALSRKFGAKFGPAQVPEAPPLHEEKSFKPPNKS